MSSSELGTHVVDVDIQNVISLCKGHADKSCRLQFLISTQVYFKFFSYDCFIGTILPYNAIAFSFACGELKIETRE